MLAFGFLAPGAQGLLGVKCILGKDFESVVIGIGQMLGMMGSIALGVPLGTVIVSSHTFVAATAHAGQLQDRKS
jgi:hypothetical protein